MFACKLTETTLDRQTHFAPPLSGIWEHFCDDELSRQDIGWPGFCSVMTCRNHANVIYSTLRRIDMIEQTTLGDVGQSQFSNGKWISKEKLNAIAGRGSEILSRVNTSATGAVRNYPVQAAVGGLIVGFALGALLCRRSV
jgi:hypothetical protein